jgi:hypothetical protein
MEASMAEIRNWQSMRDLSARLLLERTGEDVDTWNQRIQNEPIEDEKQLRAWLTERGVTGYAQSLLVMERFGYPHFLLATADELIEGQYADRPQLRPIYDAIVALAAGLGDVTIQARKTYVSLVSPRRTFARVQPTTKSRVDLGLRLEPRDGVADIVDLLERHDAPFRTLAAAEAAIVEGQRDVAGLREELRVVR